MRSGRTVRWMGIYSCYNMMDSFVAVRIYCALGSSNLNFEIFLWKICNSMRAHEHFPDKSVFIFMSYISTGVKSKRLILLVWTRCSRRDFVVFR
ncbi:hypothetical protein V1478_011146 [Vespula squamosa]|uniref:Uncharacterized protein n=1 Tax=Vespula squamosa TaxID=30214 RepID=A0ABD2AGG8_VESSQ